MSNEPLMYQNLRRLITVIDELRDVGLQQYINLPRICVVGTQSAGKSSVLEAIVGMDFLPRGEGVVTRRPLELRLVHVVPEGEEASNWAVFEAKKGKKFTNFEEVRMTIDALTEEVAGLSELTDSAFVGRNKGIVDDPIVLTVYGQNCPDLTLIDLPGITRVPIKGSDQTDDIERLTREMTGRYARDPRTIILAVIPANADMSTSDALQLARRVDPKGLRTIGVITKIDLMDRGTDASRMLHGEEIPLRLGYTGVRNRSQAEIKSNVSIQEALKEEKKFFSNHPIYRSLPTHMTGTQSLIEKLTRVLFRHIRNYLPEIKREINTRLRSTQLRLEELGTGVPFDPAERVQLMWSMITDYCEVFRNTIRGKFDKKIQAYFENQDITSGAQIRGIFNELLEEFVNCSVTTEMTDYDIDLAIRMHEGDSLPGFPSPDTFEYLILPHLRKIQSPVMDCLDRVAQSLELLSQTIANRVFGRFPRLSEEVLDKSSIILLREKENTKNILENIVMAETGTQCYHCSCHSGYLFTNDLHYLLDHGSMIPMHDKPSSTDRLGRPGGDSQMPQNDVQGGPTGSVALNAAAAYNSIQNAVSNWTVGHEKRRSHYSAAFIKEIRERLDSYFGIVLRNVRDSVPKVVGYFLVRQLQEKLQFELYNDLNKADQLANLLGEPPHIVEERATLMNQIATFKNASTVLQRDPSIAVLSVTEFDESYDLDLAQLQQTNQPQQKHQDQRQYQQQQQQQQMNSQGTGPGWPMYPQTPVSHQPSQPTAPVAPMQNQPSSGNMWGFRPGKANNAERKQPSPNLFGERSSRADATSIFSDQKTANPLYS